MPPKTKRPKRKDSPEPDDDDDESERMPYFVPEEGIDIEPLALYARGLLDNRAKVKIGSHPQRPEQKGFWIISSIAVTREDIIAMIEDSRLWARENSDGHYVNSETARRRMRLGRAQAAKERPIAQARSQREREYEEARPATTQPLARGSADNITTADRHSQQKPAVSPRPATVQPTPYESRDTRRAPPAPQARYENPGYMTATAQYTVSVPAPQAAHASYSSEYGQDTQPPPPPYSDDTKRGGGGSQPSTTGTQGFARYATAGPPDQQKPASRHQSHQGHR